MFKHSENEEDLFFASVNTSSKLASIFDTTVVPDTSESSAKTDLTYSAPKQPPSIPQMDKISAKKSTGSHVSLVKVVYGYKYVNNAYESLGKVGFALVEYPETNQHNIILYKDKNNHIFNIKVHNKIVITIQEDKYLTLLDEQKRNWSLLFENQMDLKEFYKKLETTNAKILQTDVKEEKEVNTSSRANALEQPTTQNDVKVEKQENIEEEITTKSKTDILTRMAKVGQLVGLPSQTQVHSTEITDSESDSDERISSTKTTKRSKKINIVTDLVPSKHTYSSSPIHSKCILVQQNQQIHENLNTLLTENRTNSTEIHTKLLKVEDKIDKLFDKLRIGNENEVSSEIQKLQLQNEKLKLELQKIQINKLLNSQKNLNEKKEIGVQSNISLINECDPNLECIGEASSEIKTLRENYEKLLKEIENIEKRNRVQELKIHDLEAHYFQMQPIRKLDDIDEEAVVQNINEFTEENNDIYHELKHILDSIQEYMCLIELQDRKLHHLKKYLSSIDHNLIENNDMVNEIEKKLNDFNQYIEQIQQIKDTLKETLKSINYFEDKIKKQEVKLNEFITNLQENHPSHQNSAITTNTSCSDMNISICSACLQSRANLKHKEETPQNSEPKKTAEEKVENLTEISKRKIGDNIAPFIKEEMNLLFSELQNVLKDECRMEATSMIVQATYRIIHNINSSVSL